MAHAEFRQVVRDKIYKWFSVLKMILFKYDFDNYYNVYSEQPENKSRLAELIVSLYFIAYYALRSWKIKIFN